MLNMLNDVPSKNITSAFNAWKECGEITATALTKLAEQRLELAGAWLNIGSSQLKLLSKSNGAAVSSGRARRSSPASTTTSRWITCARLSRWSRNRLERALHRACP